MPDLADLRRYRDDKAHEVILSVDLGERRDFTAFTVSEVRLERRENKRTEPYTVKVINVRGITRLPLNTDYNIVAQRIHETFWDERLHLIDANTKRTILPTLLVDYGGPGPGVAANLYRMLGKPFIRYQLTRGSAQTKKKSRYDYTVPSTTMFQLLYAAFNDDRIRIDPRLNLAGALIQELENMEVERSEETGYERVVHREGEHDDMAICLAASNWWANRPRSRPLRAITDERTAMRLMGYPTEAIARARVLQRSQHGA
jgi:hypothetical protein